MEMEPVAGLRVRQLGAGLRRRPPGPGPRHPAARAAGSTARRSCSATSPTCRRTTPVAVAPRSILRRQVARRGRRRATTPWPPPSSSTTSSARPTATPPATGYADLEPAGWYLEDYHLLQGARTEDFHAAVRRHLNALRRAGRELEGRVGPRPARAQRPLRRGPRDGRPPRRLQAVPQGDRRPHGRERHLHGQAVRRPGRLELPHPPQPLARTARNAFAGDQDSAGIACADEFRWFLGGWLRPRARA